MYKGVLVLVFSMWTHKNVKLLHYPRKDSKHESPTPSVTTTTWGPGEVGETKWTSTSSDKVLSEDRRVWLIVVERGDGQNRDRPERVGTDDLIGSLLSSISGTYLRGHPVKIP